MTRRSAVTVGAFLAWTIFVWGIVRVRNILGDDALTGSERRGPLLLSATLWVPAVVLGVAFVVALLRRQPLAGWTRTGVALLGVWTTLVWLVRAVDIALVSDHELPFVVVHVVLAIISVALAVLAARSLRPVPATHAAQPLRS